MRSTTAGSTVSPTFTPASPAATAWIWGGGGATVPPALLGTVDVVVVVVVAARAGAVVVVARDAGAKVAGGDDTVGIWAWPTGTVAAGAAEVEGALTTISSTGAAVVVVVAWFADSVMVVDAVR